MKPLVPQRCRALLRWYQRRQERRSGGRYRALRGRQQGRQAGGLRLLPHPECELAPCTLQEVHEALGQTGD